MTRPRIAVVFTGGTISMRSSGEGNVPALRGADLLATVPGLDEIADVEAIDWGLVPASHLTFAQVLDIGRILEREVARSEIDGAVVVQGTDVIEETAFAWDVLPLPPKPVVVVGAMRSASQDGYDGPANLRHALVAAAAPELASQGVVVAMAGELHAADDVRKTHTHALDTFKSPNAGRLGLMTDAGVILERSRAPVRLRLIPEAAALPVPILAVVLDEPPALASDPAGLVVAAAGGGNTPPAHLEIARSLMAREVPVVLTTRCPSGEVLAGYAFPGGSTEWWEAGAVFSGTLGPLKSRVLVALGLGSGLDGPGIAAMVEAWGGGLRPNLYPR